MASTKRNICGSPICKTIWNQLPAADWPKGPKLWVLKSHFDILKPGEGPEEIETAKWRLMALVLRLCDSLGLTPTQKDGTPLEFK